MRAIAIEESGGSDKLQLADLPTPEPGADEVLIRVHFQEVVPLEEAARAQDSVEEGHTRQDRPERKLEI